MEQENDEDSDDEYYENPVEIIQEFGNHPLMAKAQKALFDQLKETQYKLDIEVIDKQDDLKNVSQDREVLGVQLYSLQQQLARLQLALENSHNEYNALVDKRLKEEEMLSDVESTNKEQTVILKEHERQQKKYVGELDSLHETLRQIENYNEEVMSEIAITRRAAYKAEQSIQNLESSKTSQDGYVDTLNKQVKAIQEQISIYTGQYNSQKVETEEAQNVIDETVQELEMISNEKKQLMLQWKAALAGLSRRDEALAQAQETLNAAESSVHDYDMEIEAAKRNQKQEQVKHETYVNVRDRLENELQWVEESVSKMKIERDQLQERYTLLNKSLAQTTAEAKKIELVSKQLQADAEATLQNFQVVTMERQKLEEELQLSINSYSNVDKAVGNLSRDQAKVLKRIHEKENEASVLENEIARMRVDILNVNSQLDQLRDQYAIVQKDVQAKESLIEKYQVEIRQRTDEIEKKIYRVDRLNKKYDKMVEGAGGDEENLGPMEGTIKQLNKEIESIVNECKSAETDWLRKQTELVGVASEIDKLLESNNELQARSTILTQQQQRLKKDLNFLGSEVKGAQQSNVDLQKDVSKLNVLISKNHLQESELQNANYSLELSCIEELKDMEKDSVNLQTSINEAKNAKNKMLDEIIEEERQALLWEKKIQLDKETREALDPSVGETEVQNMEREIHRMEIRLDTLKREQERLSAEMEKAVLKRTVIANRFSKSAPSGDLKKTTNKELTQAAAKKKIAALKKDARALAEETSRYNSSIEEKKMQISNIASELENTTLQFGESNQTNFKLQGQVNDLLYQKQLNQERISYQQKYIKRIKDLSANGIDSTQHLNIERRLLSGVQSLDNVKEIIMGLTQMHPHLQEVLSRVLAMADPGIDW